MNPKTIIPPQDAHFKKIVELRHQKNTLHFRVAQALFSSHQIDVGTVRLLRSLKKRAEMAEVHKILDLGCGYGPLGLTLKSLVPQREVHLVDRDALALTYTLQNAALNQLQAVSVYGSLGYDDVNGRDFDLILSNIPGKVGAEAITHMVLDAKAYLRPGGWVALVVVAPLAEWIAELLQQPYIEVLFQETRAGYAIFHYRFADSATDENTPVVNALAQGVYAREQLTVTFNDIPLTMHTARGLPEFDSLSYHSQLLLKTLFKLKPSSFQRLLALNPGQGYIPLAVWDTYAPSHIQLVSRDLLGLRYTAPNLIANGCSAANVNITHQVGLDTASTPDVDLITYPLRKDESVEIVIQVLCAAATHLQTNGTLLIVGSSTAITRLLKSLATVKQLRLLKRRKNKGQSLLILRK